MKKALKKQSIVSCAGISLIELIIILAVAAIIGAFAIVALLNKQQPGNASNASGALKTISAAQTEIEPDTNINEVSASPENQNVKLNRPKIADNEPQTGTDRLYLQYNFFDHVSAGRCTGPVTVGRLDTSGNPIMSENATLQLLAPQGVMFFANGGCIEESTSVNIRDGASTAEFFFRPVGVNEGQLVASSDGFTNAETKFLTNEKAAQGIQTYFIRDTTDNITDLQLSLLITDETLTNQQINGFRIDAQNQLSPLPTPYEANLNINTAGYYRSDWKCITSDTALSCSGTETLQTGSKSLFDIFFNTTDFTPPSTLTIDLLHDGSVVTWVDAPLTTESR